MVQDFYFQLLTELLNSLDNWLLVSESGRRWSTCNNNLPCKSFVSVSRAKSQHLGAKIAWVTAAESMASTKSTLEIDVEAAIASLPDSSVPVIATRASFNETTFR